jgi:transglutaminase-like putative cysteine protease
VTFSIPSGWHFSSGSDAMRTAKKMAAVTRSAVSRNARLIAFANRVGRTARPYSDPVGTISKIRFWMDRNFNFMNDPLGVESLKSPVVLLEEVEATGSAQGDCDEAAMLVAAFGVANGLPARFRVLSFGPGEPFSHVLTDLYANGDWHPVDPTKPPNMSPGTNIYRQFTVAV